MIVLALVALAAGFGLGRLNATQFAAFTAFVMFAGGLLLSPMASGGTSQLTCQLPIPDVRSVPLAPGFPLGPERPSYEEQRATYEACIQSTNDLAWLVLLLLMIGAVGWFIGQISSGPD